MADKLWRSARLRSWSSRLRKPREDEGPVESIVKVLVILLVWITGFVSTIYLVANAAYLLFLAVVFGRYSPGTPISEYLGFVAANSLPACCFTAIGVMGLWFWLSQRLWLLGLLALLVETALAVYVFVDPEGMLVFAP